VDNIDERVYYNVHDGVIDVSVIEVVYGSGVDVEVESWASTMSIDEDMKVLLVVKQQ
jgi:hypothetical protein